MNAAIAFVSIILALLLIMGGLVLIIIVKPDLELVQLTVLIGFFSTITTGLSGALGYIARGLVEGNNGSSNDEEKKKK